MKFYYAGQAIKTAAIGRGGWPLQERRAFTGRGKKIGQKTESGFSSKRVHNIIFLCKGCLVKGGRVGGRVKVALGGCTGCGGGGGLLKLGL